MNPRKILGALGLSLLASCICTWMVSRRLTAAPNAVKAPLVKYLAPSRALEAGELLTQSNTELIAWPGNVPLEGTFSGGAGILGRQVLFPLAKDQPILDRDLSQTGSGVGLAGKIPNGMRGVALRSDEVVGVAGFLIPGSHLDVLVTYRAEGSSEPLTATVLENAVVIAAGHQMEPDPSGKILDATVVTLLLTPDEAQRAVLASTQGAIHFVLRNGEDAGLSARTPLLMSQLAGRPSVIPRPLPRVQPALVAKPSEPRGIETVLGGVGDERVGRSPEGGAGQ